MKFTTIFTAIFATSALALDRKYSCTASLSRAVLPDHTLGPYSLSCYCNAAFNGKEVNMECSAKGDSEDISCFSDYVVSERKPEGRDDSINAAITKCSYKYVTIDSNANYGSHDAQTFPFTCISRGTGKYCQAKYGY